MNLSQKELTVILTTALSAFREEIDEDITATRILTLLTVVDEPGIQQVDLEKALGGLSPSAVSRNVLDLSQIKRNREPGPDFLEQRSDPAYRKRNLIFPTAKALHWLSSLAERVSRKMAAKFAA
ncbi:hypothetical protein [Stenotrophomonas sp. RG-453]|uniref:hypothetical protein n=1 Tax=Stenotrophomonas sp. RG-453 TaxID=2957502 RepID=UPI0029CA5CA1|nr:hypothetical protein [Stenotrophomonas sp. RG-453]MDX5515121.1 hypothetical protein [Stenotrophomonas sp. RG-453]